MKTGKDQFRYFYTDLDVAAFASITEVKRAYRLLAMKYHPDKNADEPSAHEKMARINEAYAVLSDADKKSEYDRKLRSHQFVQANPVSYKYGGTTYSSSHMRRPYMHPQPVWKKTSTRGSSGGSAACRGRSEGGNMPSSRTPGSPTARASSQASPRTHTGSRPQTPTYTRHTTTRPWEAADRDWYGSGGDKKHTTWSYSSPTATKTYVHTTTTRTRYSGSTQRDDSPAPPTATRKKVSITTSTNEEGHPTRTTTITTTTTAPMAVPVSNPSTPPTTTSTTTASTPTPTGHPSATSDTATTADPNPDALSPRKHQEGVNVSTTPNNNNYSNSNVSGIRRTSGGATTVGPSSSSGIDRDRGATPTGKPCGPSPSKGLSESTVATMLTDDAAGRLVVEKAEQASWMYLLARHVAIMGSMVQKLEQVNRLQVEIEQEHTHQCNILLWKALLQYLGIVCSEANCRQQLDVTWKLVFNHTSSMDNELTASTLLSTSRHSSTGSPGGGGIAHPTTTTITTNSGGSISGLHRPGTVELGGSSPTATTSSHTSHTTQSSPFAPSPSTTNSNDNNVCRITPSSPQQQQSSTTADTTSTTGGSRVSVNSVVGSSSSSSSTRTSSSGAIEVCSPINNGSNTTMFKKMRSSLQYKEQEARLVVYRSRDGEVRVLFVAFFEGIQREAISNDERTRRKQMLTQEAQQCCTVEEHGARRMLRIQELSERYRINELSAKSFTEVAMGPLPISKQCSEQITADTLRGRTSLGQDQLHQQQRKNHTSVKSSSSPRWSTPPTKREHNSPLRVRGSSHSRESPGHHSDRESPNKRVTSTRYRSPGGTGATSTHAKVHSRHSSPTVSHSSSNHADVGHIRGRPPLSPSNPFGSTLPHTTYEDSPNVDIPVEDIVGGGGGGGATGGANHYIRVDKAAVLQNVLIQARTTIQELATEFGFPLVKFVAGKSTMKDALQEADHTCNQQQQGGGGGVEYLTSLCMKCPISQAIMDIPVRGLKCKHSQCYDLKSFVSKVALHHVTVSSGSKRTTSATSSSNNSRPPSPLLSRKASPDRNSSTSRASSPKKRKEYKLDGWKCPLCAQDVKPTDLVVDWFVAGLLEHRQKGQTVVEGYKPSERSWEFIFPCDWDKNSQSDIFGMAGSSPTHARNWESSETSRNSKIQLPPPLATQPDHLFTVENGTKLLNVTAQKGATSGTPSTPPGTLGTPGTPVQQQQQEGSVRTVTPIRCSDSGSESYYQTTETFDTPRGDNLMEDDLVMDDLMSPLSGDTHTPVHHTDDKDGTSVGGRQTNSSSAKFTKIKRTSKTSSSKATDRSAHLHHPRSSSSRASTPPLTTATHRTSSPKLTKAGTKTTPTRATTPQHTLSTPNNLSYLTSEGVQVQLDTDSTRFAHHVVLMECMQRSNMEGYKQFIEHYCRHEPRCNPLQLPL